ncbi:MAG: hypothetical protein MN733_14260, partial [Nitrososphaera sp.]|nr:hypothetical protein [Nitrososphaera sp.]
ATTYQFFNKVFIWVDKKTGLVDNYGFREEFAVQCNDCETLSKSPTHSVIYMPFGVHVGNEQCAER